MSEELIKKNTDLEGQLANYKSGIDALSAQLDAHKQMLNESLNTILQLRTSNIMIQKQMNESIMKAANCEQEVSLLKDQLANCNKVVAEDRGEVAA